MTKVELNAKREVAITELENLLHDLTMDADDYLKRMNSRADNGGYTYKDTADTYSYRVGVAISNITYVVEMLKGV